MDITNFTDLVKLEEICKEAVHNSNTAKAIGSVGGCGRVYVSLGTIRSNSKVMKILEKHFKMTKRPHYKSKQLYVGYDNATGREWDKGCKIMETFKKYDIDAYVDGDGD